MRAVSRSLVGAALAVALVTPGSTLAAPLIVNEFNAVGGSQYLDGGTATMDGAGNTENLPEDTYFGRIQGNGGDWIELAVIGDHLRSMVNSFFFVYFETRYVTARHR